MNTYTDHVISLCTLLDECNAADSDDSMTPGLSNRPYWTRPEDARGGAGLHGQLGHALTLLAGDAFTDYFFTTGEKDLSLLPGDRLA